MKLKTLKDITKPICSTEHGELEGQPFLLNDKIAYGTSTGEWVRKQLRQEAIEEVCEIAKVVYKEYQKEQDIKEPIKVLGMEFHFYEWMAVIGYINKKNNLTKTDYKDREDLK